MNRTLKADEYRSSPGYRPDEPGSSHDLMLQMIGSRKSVLEFGCSDGQMSEMLASAGCRVTGVEIDPIMATKARAYCDDVIVGDLDACSLDDLLPDRTFDVLVFGDVLEHLHDPWRVLSESRRFIAPGGYAVLSIPNVAHGSVRLALLSGSFDYTEGGLLDDTHVRFFTYQTVIDLCTRAGFRIEAIDRTKAGIFLANPWMPHVAYEDFDPATVDMVLRDPEAETFQYVVKAVPLSEAKTRDAIFKQLATVRAEVEDLLREARTVPERRANELQHRLNLESERTAALTARIAERSGEIAHVNRSLTALLSGPGEGAELDPAAAQSIEKFSELLLLLRARLSESAAEIDHLTAARVELTLANADARMEAATRTLERELAETARARAGELIEITAAELAALRASLAARDDEAARSRLEIQSLHARLAEVHASVEHYREAYASKDAEFAALGVLHRSLSDTDRDRLAAIAVKEREIAQLTDDARAERERHAATQTIFSEYLAYEIANTRHQAAIVDRMVAAYRSSKWWSLKRLLGMKRR